MTYTHGHHESVLRSHKWRTVDNSAAYLAPYLTLSTDVLDVGCGPGTITADIGRRVAPRRVLGIDASADVIEQARRDTGGGPNVEFSVGDLCLWRVTDGFAAPALRRSRAGHRGQQIGMAPCPRGDRPSGSMRTSAPRLETQYEQAVFGCLRGRHRRYGSR